MHDINVKSANALAEQDAIVDRKAQTFCLWAGAAFIPLYLVGFIFSNFMPLPSASFNAEQITAFFAANRMSILIGMSICNVATILPILFSVVMYGQMTRIERGIKTFSFVQLTAGVLAPVAFCVPGYMWLALAYRTGHNPDTVLLLNDFAWIAWVISWAPFAVQCLAFGICILSYDRNHVLFPSWAGWISVALAVALIPATFVVFFTAGPFSWNGVFGIYFPMASFFSWDIATIFVLHRAIRTSLQ